VAILDGLRWFHHLNKTERERRLVRYRHQLHLIIYVILHQALYHRQKHTHTHTHTYIYIYIFVAVFCWSRKQLHDPMTLTHIAFLWACAIKDWPLKAIQMLCIKAITWLRLFRAATAIPTEKLLERNIYIYIYIYWYKTEQPLRDGHEAHSYNRRTTVRESLYLPDRIP